MNLQDSLMNIRNHNNLDLLCTGKLYLDIIFSGLPRLPILGEEILSENVTLSLGGGAAITAVGASRLDLKTGVMGAVAEGILGDYVVSVLKTHFVNTDSLIKVTGVENNVSVSLGVSDDRSMIAFGGVDYNSTLYSEKKSSILSARHLHVKGLNMERASLLEFATKNGVSTSLDINLQTPNQAQILLEILPQVDIFLPSAWEVATIFDKTPMQIIRELGRLTRKYCVIKLGSEGSIASQGNVVIKQATNPVKVLDATGAGDAFDAGFLWAYLQDKPIEQCLKAGTIAAELCLQVAGGISWVNRINHFYNLFYSE